jgi:hypothetical protein
MDINVMVSGGMNHEGEDRRANKNTGANVLGNAAGPNTSNPINSW